MPYKSKLLGLTIYSLLSISGFFGANAHAQEVDLSPEQKSRVRAEKVEAAIHSLPKNYKFVSPGKFTVASVPGNLPLAAYATDN